MPHTNTIQKELEEFASRHPVVILHKKGLVLEPAEGAPMRGILSLDRADYPDDESHQQVLAEIEQAKNQNGIIRYGYLVTVDCLPDYATHPEMAFLPAKE